ncbi:MAG: DMT family transporter [Sphingomonadales bacterium]|nr:DMT family transporter [Sphingomonadales bacterium]
MPPTRPPAARDWQWRHVAALVIGNAALALGPWWVRLADSGPVSAGFWRLALALPVLALLARREAAGAAPGGRQAWLTAAAGVFFALDLAAWHLGIVRTRLGNSTLFGNSGSLIVMAWGLVTARRAPRAAEWAALAAALAGAAILFGRSFAISPVSFVGDMLCLLAGLFYAAYILLLRNGRAHIGNWSLLVGATLAGAPVLLAIALQQGEPVWPRHWGPLVTLALSSQVLGQGLIVYALRHFSPLMIGLGLLTQPVVGVLVGALVFHEPLGAMDLLGMLLVASALVLARAGER